MPELQVNTVGTTGDGDRLLVLIHGYGADEYDLAPLAPHIDPEGRFFTICPRGPRDVMGFGAGWYGRSDEGPIDATTFLSSVDAIDTTVDKACADHGFDRSQAVFIGFSQGGAMALASTLRESGAVRPAAVACLSGRLQHIDGLRYAFEGPAADEEASGGPRPAPDTKLPKLPEILVHHGTVDPVVSIDDGRHIHATLDASGVSHLYREYPMQHEISPQSIHDLRDWLAAR